MNILSGIPGTKADGRANMEWSTKNEFSRKLIRYYYQFDYPSHFKDLYVARRYDCPCVHKTLKWLGEMRGYTE